MTPLEQYERWYTSKPLWWRFKNRAWWILDSTWSAIRGRPGPGERWILRVGALHRESKR